MKIDDKYFCTREVIGNRDEPLKEFLSKWKTVTRSMRSYLDTWLRNNVHTAKADHFDIWYRGVFSDSEPYCLTPGSQRPPKLSIEHERVMFLDFERLSKRSDIRPFESFWSIYIRMQHYGMPTRLLDWSEGHLIALHFALCGPKELHSNEDLNPAVFFIFPQLLNYLSEYHSKYGQRQIDDVKAIHVGSTEKFNAFRFTCDSVLGMGNRTDAREHPLYNYQLLWGDSEKDKYPQLPRAMWPAYLDVRIRVQKSVFTIHGQPEGFQKATEPFGEDLTSPVLPLLGKIEIQKDVVAELRRQLVDAGISQSTLFPELDGVADELKYEFSDSGRKGMLPNWAGQRCLTIP
jgi:hypothetical protein